MHFRYARPTRTMIPLFYLFKWEADRKRDFLLPGNIIIANNNVCIPYSSSDKHVPIHICTFSISCVYLPSKLPAFNFELDLALERMWTWKQRLWSTLMDDLTFFKWLWHIHKMDGLCRLPFKIFCQRQKFSILNKTSQFKCKIISHCTETIHDNHFTTLTAQSTAHSGKCKASRTPRWLGWTLSDCA